MDLQEIAGTWPCAPSRARIERLIRLAEENPDILNGDPDAIRSERFVEILCFSNWAGEEMQRKLDQGGINSGADLAMIAGEGSNQHLIGILVRWGGTQDEKAECVITCLHWDPEWVGINPLLEYCRPGDPLAGRDGQWTVGGHRHHVHILEMNGESYRLKHIRESASTVAKRDPFLEPLA